MILQSLLYINEYYTRKNIKSLMMIISIIIYELHSFNEWREEMCALKT